MTVMMMVMRMLAVLTHHKGSIVPCLGNLEVGQEKVKPVVSLL